MTDDTKHLPGRERVKALTDAKHLLDRAGSCLGMACMRLGLKEHPLDNRAKADGLITEAREKASRGLKLLKECENRLLEEDSVKPERGPGVQEVRRDPA